MLQELIQEAALVYYNDCYIRRLRPAGRAAVLEKDAPKMAEGRAHAKLLL